MNGSLIIESLVRYHNYGCELRVHTAVLTVFWNYVTGFLQIFQIRRLTYGPLLTAYRPIKTRSLQEIIVAEQYYYLY